MAKYQYIVGIDEVGRGPLAGPITVTAVAAIGNSKHEIRNPKLFKRIKDSKAISAKKREEWFKILRGYAEDNKIFFATSSVSNSVIDKIGIANAARLAIFRSLQKLVKSRTLDNWQCRVLLDGGLKAPAGYKNQQTIPKGDSKIPIIAAASIMAKVMRDRKMVRFAREYPEYGFDIHKGYGTKMHSRAIKKQGLCDIHRRSFCTKFIRKGLRDGYKI